MDNRIKIVYNIEEQVEEGYMVAFKDGLFYTPPLLTQAKQLLNAITSIGLIYEKSYALSNGIFQYMVKAALIFF